MKIFTSICSLGMLLFPHFCNAQAPDLGSTASFALFTSVGAVTNTGSSHITGNVGTNAGATTGFGNVNGVMHNGDGATLTAANDLTNAYTQLDTITPTAAHAPLLGNGDTLTPGIYAIAGNTVASQVLYLDASGNQDAVFIFQIDGTFSVNGLAEVRLLNGAKPCNIFWKAEGMVSIGTGASLSGTILANNAAIDIAPNVTLNGRALSTSGAVSLNGVLVFTPEGCGSPVLTGPAPPDLATTSCYALFTGNGSNISTGNTIVEGDAGTNVGLTVGYNPLSVNGTIHLIPDTSTAACAADLINVHTYLHALPADIELLYPAQFGNSLVLTPHTYLLNAATSLTDTLFLNAQGNPDAVFVIKINGAFSTSTYATIVLLNGTMAQNVYWDVDGAVDINNFSIFKGTIVCNNGAINLRTGTQITGRALTTDGAFTVDQLNIALPTPCLNSVLPLSWLYFTGKPTNQSVTLQWGITGATSNGHFNIERSADGRTFGQLQSVAVSSESNNKESHYSFADKHPLLKGYYRISVTTEDNKISYFRTIEITSNSMSSNAGIFSPNPWKNNLTVTLPEASVVNEFELILRNVAGSKVFGCTIATQHTQLNIKLPSGAYYYQLTSQSGKTISGKIISE